MRAHHAIKRSIQQIIPISDKHFDVTARMTIETLQALRTKRSPNTNYTIISIVESDSMKNYSRPDPINMAGRRPNEPRNVHVKLPIATSVNRTNLMDEVEDLALRDLNGTEAVERQSANSSAFGMFMTGNSTLPEAAMLISGRIRYPANNKIGPGKQRSCELFGHICLRVEDYPM